MRSPDAPSLVLGDSSAPQSFLDSLLKYPASSYLLLGSCTLHVTRRIYCLSTLGALKHTVSGPPANSASAALTLPALPAQAHTIQDVPKTEYLGSHQLHGASLSAPFKSTRYYRYRPARPMHAPCNKAHIIRSCTHCPALLRSLPASYHIQYLRRPTSYPFKIPPPPRLLLHSWPPYARAYYWLAYPMVLLPLDASLPTCNLVQSDIC